MYYYNDYIHLYIIGVRNAVKIILNRVSWRTFTKKPNMYVLVCE